jgi:transposase
LGRSRGGYSSKIVLTAADENTAIAVDVVPGQTSDATLLEPMLKPTIERVPVIDELVGDKGFDGDEQRAQCINRDIFANIPNRCNRLDPWEFLPEGYRERNKVERLFSKVKQFRRIATRYEKLKETFCGMIHLVLGFIGLRGRSNVNRT